MSDNVAHQQAELNALQDPHAHPGSTLRTSSGPQSPDQQPKKRNRFRNLVRPLFRRKDSKALTAPTVSEWCPGSATSGSAIASGATSPAHGPDPSALVSVVGCRWPTALTRCQQQVGHSTDGTTADATSGGSTARDGNVAAGLEPTKAGESWTKNYEYALAILKTSKEIAEAIPVVSGPIKAACGIGIIIVESLRVSPCTKRGAFGSTEAETRGKSQIWKKSRSPETK